MNKKVLKTLIVVIITLIFGITFVYAENEIKENTVKEESSKNEIENTEETSNNSVGNTSSNQTTQNSNTQKETTQTPNASETTQQTNKTKVKSSNANLSNLGITPNDFSGFTENKTSYSVSVPNTVKSVEVYAKAKDSKASISGIGKIELKEGINTANVTVTAEDGTTKKYTITITRLKQGEKISENDNSSISLEKLEIEGFNIEPEFNPEQYVYTVNFEGEQTSLNIIAETNKTSDIIQIIGNENLMDGTNIVTVIVSNSKENSSVIYQINVNKNLEKQRVIQKEIEDSELSHKIKVWIIKILIGIIIIGLIALIIIKRKKERLYDRYENEDDLPKSLRKSKEKDKAKKIKRKKKSKGKHSK